MEAVEHGQPGDGSRRDVVDLRIQVPRSWRDALAEAAQVQGISMAGLCRIILGKFLRSRYTADEQATLAGGRNGGN